MNIKQKKILMLGGLRYLIPVIKAAHELGYYVITCDYIPDNIAHQYSDEYYNVSIIDKDAVLALAKELNIDGIMSFAVDPGVVTAAYVSEQLGLPGHPYESVKILQNKALFRQFLTNNGFTVPKSKGYHCIEDALAEVDYFTWPIMVKPVDSAGSKGVTKVKHPDGLSNAVVCALDSSLSKMFIVEEFIEKAGCSSDSDGFSVNGELQFVSFSDQRFDDEAANPYTPSAYSWPSTIDEKYQLELSHELQRLLRLLDMKTSVYNIEVRIGLDGRAYIMEVSPRGGGNRLSEMLRYSTGVDLIKNAVRAAVGDEVIDLASPIYNGNWAEIIIHADKDGIFQAIEIDEEIQRKYVMELDLWINQGELVKSFNGANDAIGTLVVRFETEEELSKMMSCTKQWLKIVVE